MARKNAAQREVTGAALPKFFSDILRPRAKVQGGAKIQSVVSRSIVAKSRDTLQSLVRDFLRQDVPYVVPHCILHLCPPELRRKGSRMSVRWNVR